MKHRLADVLIRQALAVAAKAQGGLTKKGGDTVQNRKTIKNNLLNPMKDKTRLMRTEHLLSNNYVLAAIIGMVDLLLLFAGSYTTHLFTTIPDLLLQRITMEEFFSPRNLLPSSISLTGVILFLVVVAVVDVILIFRIKISWSEDHFNVGQQGVERFLDEEEIKEEYKEIEPLETPYPGNPGILISRIGNKFYIDDNVVNNLGIGPTRTGKGELLAKPSIEIYSRAQYKPSLIINDTKLEHYKVFRKVLEERGYDVYLLNASNPKLSMGFNMFTVAISYYKKKDYDMSEMVVKSIAHSLFNVERASGDMIYFVNAASDLFAAMVLASIEDAITQDELDNQTRYEQWKNLTKTERKAHPFQYRTDNEKTINLYGMIVNFGELVTKPVTKDGSKTLLDNYFEQRPTYDRARLKYLGVQVAPGKTKAGVFSEMLREVSVFTLHNVAKMTAESTLDLAEIGFGTKPIAVFLAIPSYDSSLYKLPTIFIRQMYYVLGKLCDDGKGKCDRQVKIIFDEAGNMPEIEMMKVMITMGLGQNISFDLYVQNYEQLTEVYGKEIAQTIKGNCSNHYFIQTKSEETAKEFSTMLGNKSIIDVQRAGGKLSWNKYFTESIKERPLLNMNELKALQEGECVISRTSKRKDLRGNKIKPRPIFNSVENGHYFWYAHEFFPKEKYPHPNEINFLDVCKESRAHIEPRERIWDIRKSFQLLRNEENKLRTLKDVGYERLVPLFCKSFGEHFEEQYGISADMSVATAADMVQRQQIPDAEKETIQHMLAG